MIYCRELAKNFNDEASLFAELKANKEQILALKKAAIQKSCDKGAGITVKSFDLSKLGEEIKGLKLNDDYYHVVVNSTDILDSHGDLHIKNLWANSIKESQGKNYLVMDHDLQLNKVVAKAKDIEMFTAIIPFSAIGKSYPGNTEALIYKFKKESVVNSTAKEWLSDDSGVEASVRMKYISVKLAMNSSAAADKEELKNYNDHIGTIANKDEFEQIPYFFIVDEAQNVKESSLVLFGSNSSTGIINNKQEQEKTSDTARNIELLKQLLSEFKK